MSPLLRQKQKQVLSLTLLQKQKFLILSYDKLDEYLNLLKETNPLLSYTSSRFSAAMNLDYIDSLKDERKETLYEHVKDEIALDETLTEDEQQIIKLIAINLDDNGCFTLNVDDFLKEFNIKDKKETFEKALCIIHNLSPVGMGFPTGLESLKYQLVLKKDINANIKTIADKLLSSENLEELSKKNYKTLSKRLYTSEDNIRKAYDEIKLLTPYPGCEYKKDTNNVIYPDVAIKKDEKGELVISFPYSFLDDIKIDEETESTLINSKDKKAQSFIKKNKANALSIINMIKEREETLYKLSLSLAYRTRPAFLCGIEKLTPVKEKDVAEDIQKSLSTVSRLKKNKYIETDFGTFPLKRFFEKN